MDKKRKIITIIFLALTVVTTIVIIVNAFIPEAQSVAMSDAISDRITEIYTPTDKDSFYTLVRKSLGHFLLNGVNAGFMALTLMFYLKDKGVHRGLGILASLFYGCLIAGMSEFIQLFVQGRGATWKDVGINCLGCLAFVFIIGLVYSIKYFVKSKKDKRND